MTHTFSILQISERTVSYKPIQASNTHRFKDSIVTTIIGPRHEARSSHQPRAHVAHHIPVQIGHDHHIKLLWFGHELNDTNGVK